MRIFTGSVLRSQLSEDELAALRDDFRRYKSGELPDTFGRDVPYDHPHTLPSARAEELRHIHLAPAGRSWPVHVVQFRRTSDIHLVYAQGAIYDDCFLLIAILKPDAHAQARDNNVMARLVKAAELFRLKY